MQLFLTPVCVYAFFVVRVCTCLNFLNNKQELVWFCFFSHKKKVNEEGRVAAINVLKNKKVSFVIEEIFLYRLLLNIICFFFQQLDTYFYPLKYGKFFNSYLLVH